MGEGGGGKEEGTGRGEIENRMVGKEECEELTGPFNKI